MATEVTSARCQNKRSPAEVLLMETPIKQLSTKNTFVRILKQFMGKFTVHHGSKKQTINKNLRGKKKMQSKLKSTCVLPSSSLSQAATAQGSDWQDKAGASFLM